MKQLFNLFLPMLAVTYLTACSAQQNNDVPKTIDTTNLEPIYGHHVKKDVISFSVKSTGCTKPSDFSLELNYDIKDTTQVTLIRNQADKCRAMPRVTRIDLQLTTPAKQANNELVVLNPVSKFKDKPVTRR